MTNKIDINQYVNFLIPVLLRKSRPDEMENQEMSGVPFLQN